MNKTSNLYSNPNFPYSSVEPGVMLVDVHALAAKMLKSMTRDRALQVATNIHVNHTINEADKKNWAEIIKILDNGRSKPNSVVTEKQKAKNADYTVPDKLIIGKSYHLSWAHKGCVWRLVEVSPCGKKAVMITRKTRKMIEVEVKDILNIRDRKRS